MRTLPISFLVAILACGCIHPEARGLKHPDAAQLEAGWNKWDRPDFYIAAPDNWSPYISRVQQQVPPPEGEQPTNTVQWTIIDKDGDEILIENLGKGGIPLRLFDNSARNAAGVIQTQLSIKADPSNDSIPDEVKKYKKTLANSYKSHEKVELPVGTAYLFRTETEKAKGITFLMINGDTRYLAQFETTLDPANLELTARKIMETFRVKG